MEELSRPDAVGKVGNVLIFQLPVAEAIQYAIDFFDRSGGVYTGFIYINHESLTSVDSPSYQEALRARGVSSLSELFEPLHVREIHMGATWSHQEQLAQAIVNLSKFYNTEKFTEVLFFVSPQLRLEPEQQN